MKYGNEKTMVNGIMFDSKLEANRYWELSILQRAGKIKNLKLQPEYELQPPFRKNGNAFRKITYIADFEYEQDGKTIVEDTKGFRTEVFRIKEKLFEYKYPNLELKEIRKK